MATASRTVIWLFKRGRNVVQLKSWLPKLAYPIREGEHAQTAFAFGLILDYARVSDPALAAVVTSKVRELADGKLAHLDGLNLSRAWMLDGIASGLPAGDSRIRALRAASDTH